MKKLMIPVLLFSTAVNAQNSSINVECMSADKMETILKEYGEVSTIGGASLRLNAEGNVKREGLVLFANPSTLTWTIVEKHNDIFCVVASGTDLKILPRSKSNDI